MFEQHQLDRILRDQTTHFFSDLFEFDLAGMTTIDESFASKQDFRRSNLFSNLVSSDELSRNHVIESLYEGCKDERTVSVRMNTVGQHLLAKKTLIVPCLSVVT